MVTRMGPVSSRASGGGGWISRVSWPPKCFHRKCRPRPRSSWYFFRVWRSICRRSWVFADVNEQNAATFCFAPDAIFPLDSPTKLRAVTTGDVTCGIWLVLILHTRSKPAIHITFVFFIPIQV